MVARIDKLTPEQEARLDEWVDRLLRRVSRAGAGTTDREKFEKGAKAWYRAAGHEWHNNVVWVPSPLVLVLADSVATFMIELRRLRLGGIVQDAVRDVLDDAVRHAVRREVGDDPIGAVLFRAVSDAANRAVNHIEDDPARQSFCFDKDDVARNAKRKGAGLKFASADAVRRAVSSKLDNADAARWNENVFLVFPEADIEWALTTSSPHDFTDFVRRSRTAEVAARQSADFDTGQLQIFPREVPVLYAVDCTVENPINDDGDENADGLDAVEDWWWDRSMSMWSSHGVEDTDSLENYKNPIDKLMRRSNLIREGGGWKDLIAMRAMEKIARGWYQRRDFVMVHECPTVSHWERINPSTLRLHSADGPAIAYQDGWGVYAIHGVRIPFEQRHIVERPEAITVEEIEAEENTEIRRVMIDRYGPARYVADSGARVVCELGADHPIVGLRTARLLRKDVPRHEPIIYADLLNSTPEPDGTVKRYMLRIDPEAYDGEASRNLLAAVASTWRNADGSLHFADWRDYAPVFES
jgi:hypothetical protein